MILLTGASGKTGRAVARAVVAKGEGVRALVHRTDQVAILQSAGVEEVVVGDLLDGEALQQATRGARAVYHICPNVSPDERRIGERALEAAQKAGVTHFVFHSVLHPQTEGMPHHWNKLKVEEALFESGLAFTILQPAAYMQNLLAYWPDIVEQGAFAVPYPAETRLSLVDLVDVAEAAAIVLTEPGQVGATYELVGTPAMSQIEVAEVLSRKLRRSVRVEVQAIEAWEERARASGMGEYQRQTLIKMFSYYERYGLAGNSNVLGWLLRRPPVTFEAFVERHAG
jgi:uncharacterized protein YbjT (DUF2867 family)